MLPSTNPKASATPDKYLFGAQQPAHMNRYRRFALPSRGPTHGSRRNVVGYSFVPGDSHPLPFAS